MLGTTAIFLSARTPEQEEFSAEKAVLRKSLLLQAPDLKPNKCQNCTSVLGASIIFRLLENKLSSKRVNCTRDIMSQCYTYFNC